MQINKYSETCFENQLNFTMSNGRIEKLVSQEEKDD